LELATERDSLVERAAKYEVINAETYGVAGSLLRAIKTLGTQISGAFAEPIRLAHEAHKAGLRARDKYLKPVQEAERTVKGRMATWHQAEEQKRRAEQARLEQEARARAEDARLAEAINVEAEGNQEAAEALLAAPVAVEPPPRVADNVPKVEGVATRMLWRWQIVAAGAIPREYLIPDEKKIGATVRSMGPLARIPGVKTWEEPVIAAQG
jgi:hypothetical protein